MSANKLRLGPLPRTEPVKLAVTLSAELKATLDRYAALHAQTYGERVDAGGAGAAYVGGLHDARPRVEKTSGQSSRQEVAGAWLADMA